MLEEKIKRREREGKASEGQLVCDTMGKGSLKDNTKWRLLINALALDTE